LSIEEQPTRAMLTSISNLHAIRVEGLMGKKEGMVKDKTILIVDDE
jgi:hypothetical protein